MVWKFWNVMQIVLLKKINCAGCFYIKKIKNSRGPKLEPWGTPLLIQRTPTNCDLSLDIQVNLIICVQ